VGGAHGGAGPPERHPTVPSRGGTAPEIRCAISLRPAYPLRTARLSLRPLSPADIPTLLEYHTRADTHRFLPMAPFDEATMRQRLADGPWSRSTLDAPGDLITLGVEHRATGELLGDAMLRWHTETLGEIGYVFNPAHHGQGYATETARELLRLGFDEMGLHRITAGIIALNTPSIGVVQRLGMRQEARHVESWMLGSTWVDQLTFAILDREWGDLR
jgi:RimJ/RimL family protein N-acetyltransferase